MDCKSKHFFHYRCYVILHTALFCCGYACVFSANRVWNRIAWLSVVYTWNVRFRLKINILQRPSFRVSQVSLMGGRNFGYSLDVASICIKNIKWKYRSDCRCFIFATSKHEGHIEKTSCNLSHWHTVTERWHLSTAVLFVILSEM